MMTPISIGLRARQRRNARRPQVRFCFTVTLMLAVGCGQSSSVGGENSQGVDNRVQVKDIVAITAESSDLIVQYRTRTSIRDCKAQASQMPEVWNLIVRTRLKDNAFQRVILFPQDPTGESASFAFTKNATGHWSASAPCSIRIPAEAA